MKSNAICLLLAVSIGLSGCTAVHNSMKPSEKTSQWNIFKAKKTDKKEAKKKKKEEIPTSMVVIWKDALLEKPGTSAVRGFGARIYFHNSDNDPIKTEGELIVYGFDDTTYENDLKSKTPDKKFVFTNQEFQTHYSESDIGPSYSVWIPWEKVGGQRKTIGLIPIFRTEDGHTLNGGTSNNVLPGKVQSPEGKVVTSETRINQSRSEISRAGFNAANGTSGVERAVLNDEPDQVKKMRSTTINLTPAMARKIAETNRSTRETEPVSEAVLPSWQSPNQSNSTTTDSEFKPFPGKETVSPKLTTSSNGKDKAGDTTVNTARIDRLNTNKLGSSTEKSSPQVFGRPGSFR